MKIEFDLRKTVPENATEHYSRSKKYKRKLPGMEKAIADTKKKLENVVEDAPEEPRMRRKVERRWYEKFRWFRSSDGLLVLGGRDATTNDILVKKHLEANDLVFHANVQGAPFIVVKNERGGEVPERTITEAATAAASYSKAWSRGMGSCDVYQVNPDQVSKTPPSGEYLPKGAFMIYGEKTWHKNTPLEVAVGLLDDNVIGGPAEAVKSRTDNYVTVGVGDVKQGALAKQVRSRLGGGDLEEIQRHLPGGSGKIK
ncbi:MAG: DUF814 domain-containing protein [Candidatus Altiarchaeales archaeon]|nr:DUF814 domain-containing protein [Candidatus Altiarchaeales archaeon]MBD3416703.1 DUF814 domain-containing protein [Candidatus Altiarchaeales archaeon]